MSFNESWPACAAQCRNNATRANEGERFAMTAEKNNRTEDEGLRTEFSAAGGQSSALSPSS